MKLHGVRIANSPERYGPIMAGSDLALWPPLCILCMVPIGVGEYWTVLPVSRQISVLGGGKKQEMIENGPIVHFDSCPTAVVEK